jgi:hypothetical protein
VRKDIYEEEVLSKCKVYKACTLWPKEPKIRPKAWLNNFDVADKEIASLLLDCFIYYKSDYVDALLKSAYHSIIDLDIDLKSTNIESFLSSAVFTIITGENPNLTDSGHTIIRRVRQTLHIPEKQIVNLESAIKHAKKGGTVVFLDDFVGSGDQFIKTWTRPYGRTDPQSFQSVNENTDFVSIYITLIAAQLGLDKIHHDAPSVHVTLAHVLTQQSSIFGIQLRNISQQKLDDFLTKYSSRLRPKEGYIANNPHFLKYGYHGIGALLGFEHSIPDATLPIFWAPGIDGWVPLVERS